MDLPWNSMCSVEYPRMDNSMEIHVIMPPWNSMEIHGNPCDYAAMEFHGIPWKIHVIMPPWNSMDFKKKIPWNFSIRVVFNLKKNIGSV